ncbi:fumarylacetoacetate hydrolase family protein [Leucothrix arctica]|uniref:Fumarylacetoacetase-like C-terminal domain-containing protein n=1 Tax=Leucothrix arctica TaxID=1481894 RepID=A0A317C5H5_9GAMM|nr:fumarylacetoacetate hydrolase family protein [Leucothrix arctica]PWQ93858.1 hypothetical protein DKT75_19855 [Leucothrix arctica]
MQLLIAHPSREELLASVDLSKDIRVSRDQIQLLAPIPRPNKNVICMGLNYFDHIAEAASAAGRTARKPKAPIVFTKANTSVIGPDAAIPDDPEVSEQLDWEVELAIIIGKTGKKIPVDKVHEHIFGYTIVIATGTPDGVGFARTPAEYLKAGDVVTCKVEGIGVLENTLVAV